jgi:hypothetical protein
MLPFQETLRLPHSPFLMVLEITEDKNCPKTSKKFPECKSVILF